MKYISLDQAVSILESSSAVIINDQNQAVVYVGLNDDDEEFLNLKYECEGLEYNFHFEKSHNERVRIDASSMYLQDITHEEVELTILAPKNVES